MKQTRLKARDLFVNNGFSIPTILSILDGQVTKKTLYNWRNNEDGQDPNGTWDDQRTEKIEQFSSLKENAVKLAIAALQEAMTERSRSNLNNAAKALGILKAYQALDIDKFIPVDEVEDEQKKVDPAKIVEEVEKLLMG